MLCNASGAEAGVEDANDDGDDNGDDYNDNDDDDDDDRDVCYATYPVQMLGSGQVKEQNLAQ